MFPYMICPTCCTNIGNRTIKYNNQIDEIDNNDKLTEDIKNEMKEKLLADLKITNYCCTPRIICKVPKEKIII